MHRRNNDFLIQRKCVHKSITNLCEGCGLLLTPGRDKRLEHGVPLGSLLHVLLVQLRRNFNLAAVSLGFTQASEFAAPELVLLQAELMLADLIHFLV